MNVETMRRKSRLSALRRALKRRATLQWLGALAMVFLLSFPVMARFIKDAWALEEAGLGIRAEVSELDESLTQMEAGSIWGSETGSGLLETLGLRAQVVYVVYGRPSKHGEATWGTLGASRTAEESWQLLQSTRRMISQEIGVSEGNFALNVLNPVYRSQNGVIDDSYVRKALELAPGVQGVVALNFNSFADAESTIDRLEQVLSKALLARLAVGLDIEHFPGGQVDAAALNEFCAWFASKHHGWAGDSLTPGLVIAYTFWDATDGGKGTISNLDELVQYYLAERTLAVIIFDGYGTKEAKLKKMASLVALLANTPEYPALVGVMEFRSRWGTKYDQLTIGETFALLRGAPVFFLASQ